MRKTLLTIAIIIAALAVGYWLFVIAESPKKYNEPLTQPAPAAQPAVDNSKLVIGDASAPITIVEYGDFQCPICKRFFEQTEPQLMDEYINTGKAKIEFRVETHIGAESIASGQAAYCANDQKQFKAYHDELYKRQEGSNSGAFSNANLKQIASQLGLDRAAFDSCLDGGKYHQTVVDSDAEAQQRISGTPTFFIGEQKIVGAQPFSVFKGVLDSM